MPSQLPKFGDNDNDGDDELFRTVVKPVVMVVVYQNSFLFDFGDGGGSRAGGETRHVEKQERAGELKWFRKLFHVEMGMEGEQGPKHCYMSVRYIIIVYLTGTGGGCWRLSPSSAPSS